MSEERLEIIEKQVHREANAHGIELCREIRRLQVVVARLAEENRGLGPPRPHPPADLKPVDCFEERRP
jgi:hypothetical protein